MFKIFSTSRIVDIRREKVKSEVNTILHTVNLFQ